MLALRANSRAAFRKCLLGWYDANKRALPWRRTRDAYKIWVSEIMLQQTRVTAVVGYYKRFLEAFPNIDALARADEQTVLAHWSGLGYYRRARMLHAAVRQLTSRKQEMPRTAEGLQELPGIGRYTAAAIASIAFGEPTAVVDGNVERVLQRLAAKNESGSLNIWSAAQELIDTNRPGDFNQALMELGATVCLPKNPTCTGCPVRKWCATRGEHEVAKPAARRTATIDYLFCATGQEIVFVQRAKNARLMAGMWELPQLKRQMSTPPMLTVRHSITTTDYTVRVWRGRPPKGSVQLNVAQAAQLPLTGVTRKILRRLSLLRD